MERNPNDSNLKDQAEMSVEMQGNYLCVIITSILKLLLKLSLLVLNVLE